MTTIRPARKPAAPKIPVHEQNCGNCYWQRGTIYGLECRYDKPPWEPVYTKAWCRRWKQQEPKPAAKSEPRDTEAKGA